MRFDKITLTVPLVRPALFSSRASNFIHLHKSYNINVMMDKDSIQKRIAKIESEMGSADFWTYKERAQKFLAEYQTLKQQLAGVDGYDKGDAIVSILSGAGGDDAEDFSAMLFRMYSRFAERKNWKTKLLFENRNSHGGFRNVSFEVTGQGVYGELKHENGVHRLVRISPFNAQGKRQTSFSMVEVVPQLPPGGPVDLKPDEVDVIFQKAGGRGGQNGNKREPAVRATHKPTGLTVHVTTERAQAQNKEKALEVLRGKLFKKQEEDRAKKARGLSISATVSIEWGSQIRSYVLHPYQMVKDHRTEYETSNTDAVLDGDIQSYIDAAKATGKE